MRNGLATLWKIRVRGFEAEDMYLLCAINRRQRDEAGRRRYQTV